MHDSGSWAIPCKDSKRPSDTLTCRHTKRGTIETKGWNQKGSKQESVEEEREGGKKKEGARKERQKKRKRKENLH